MFPLRCGVIHAQHLAAAPVNRRQAFEDVVHILDAEGKLDLFAAQPGSAHEKANAVLVQCHVRDRQSHGVHLTAIW
jgi:hypothetical protein